MIALVDINNCYVSCQRIFEPRLEGKPVVALSGGDGCVIARSNEAKALGIAMGTPWYQLRDLARQHGVIAFSEARNKLGRALELCYRVPIEKTDWGDLKV